MKQTDRFLMAIIAGVVILVGVALALAFARPAQAYLPETTPGAIAYNYVFALKQRDDARAYGYLSPELERYPETLEAFSAEVGDSSWNFNRESATLAIAAERIADERIVVTLNETRFYEGGLFGSSQYSNSFSVTLKPHAGSWKIIDADAYWSPCWAGAETWPCQ